MIERKAARAALLVMAKAPLLGHGKSRLAADLGSVEAWRINRMLHAKTLRAVRDPRWSVTLCVTPRSALRLLLPGIWPHDIPRKAQGGGDLGQRLARVLSPCWNVAVIGTDCPAIDRAHIASAFAALRRAPFALGPAEDGGFWILAARSGRAAVRAMAGVRWSTRNAAADILSNLGAANVVRLATLRDIDTAADLRL
jgi:rSAM/selenodomain-associated transferase 1